MIIVLLAATMTVAMTIVTILGLVGDLQARPESIRSTADRNRP